LPKFRASGQLESKTNPFRPHQAEVPVLSQFHLMLANVPGHMSRHSSSLILHLVFDWVSSEDLQIAATVHAPHSLSSIPVFRPR